MATTYIHRTPSTQGSLRKMTFSAWIKKSQPTQSTTWQWMIHSGDASDGDPSFGIGFKSDSIGIIDLNSSYAVNLVTTRKFRDCSSWYHIVVGIDTEQGSSADRIKVWVNGVQETSFATNTQPSQNHDMDGGINKTTYATELGRDNYGGGEAYFNGYMAQVHWIDGTQYAASDFGETDTTTGEWKGKTSPSVTYGTNGFFLKFEDSSNLDLDSSPNAHTFTTSGNLIQSQDNPDNIFATWNPDMNPTGSNSNYGMSFTDGANSVNPTSPDANGSRNYTCSTLAMSTSKGKYYAEFKIAPGNDIVVHLGIVGTDAATNRFHYNNIVQDSAEGIAFDTAADRIRGNGSDIVGSLTHPSANDIVGLAVDMDNKKFYAYLNGTLLNSGGSSFSSFFTEPFAYFYVGDGNTSGYDGIQANFGNGYFGTSAIASPNSDSASLGKFKYTVPSGYYALCTKNLNTQG